MELDIQIVHGVSELTRSAWDQMSEDRPFSGYAWYQYGEAVLADCQPTYIFLSHAGETLARATLWLKHWDSLPTTSKIARIGLERWVKQWPLFVCESPLSFTSGLTFAQPSQNEKVLEAITEVALDLGRKAGASCVIFRYLRTPQPRWGLPYARVAFNDPDTYLEIMWSDFESYLASMAHSTRRNYRLHCKEAANLGIQVTAHSTVVDVEAALSLIRNVETFHQAASNPYARGMLENLSQTEGAWLSAHIADRLVGCCCMLGDAGVQRAVLLGLDYDLPQHTYVYYQLMYGLVQQAIAQKVQILYGGDEAYEFKRRLGFQTDANTHMMVAATSPLLARPLQWLAKSFSDSTIE